MRYIYSQALNKPVIITNYGTANSQLHDRKNGIIVSLGNKECAMEIGKVIENIDLQNKIIMGCKSMLFPNDFDVLYNLSEVEL